MTTKGNISRTVQYWRLLDARDNSIVEEYDWESFFAKREGQRYKFVVDGVELSGTVRRYSTEQIGSAFDEISETLGGSAPSSCFGIVISAQKDYIPQQEHVQSGEQRPMGRAGDDWEPVDNLFVWHIPFGNMIAVLAESVSSVRAARYAVWITYLLRNQGAIGQDNPQFVWGAKPVIDVDRAERLQQADRLKSMVVGGAIGRHVASPMGRMTNVFSPPSQGVDGVTIEVKVGIARGKGTVEDERYLLQWFERTFGSLEGATKARVLAGIPGEQPTEIDLLSHRLTRKKSVTLEDEVWKVISAKSAFNAIVDAFRSDVDDLRRLSNSLE